MSDDLGACLRVIEAELRRWRDEGQTVVQVSDAAMEALRLAVQAQSRAEGSSRDDKAAVKLAPKATKQVKPSSLPEPPELELPEGDRSSQWEWLRDRVLNCATCQSNLNPKGKIVFGEGDPDADLFFCGEAPGADEEIKGEPFVGKAGALLDKIISGMGLKREETYIANVMKWRPQHENPYGNRPPTQEEMHFCLPYLKAQITLVEPKVIVALGATAVSGLLGPDPSRRMGKARGNWHTFEKVPLMVTFHPSYLLRNGSAQNKRKVWEDMLVVMEKLDLSISEKQRGFYT
jgi:DNA polymerase